MGTQAEQAITEGRPGTITFKVMDVDSVFDVDGDPEGVKAMFGCEFTDTGRIESALVADVAKTLNGDGTYTYTVTVTVTPKPYQCHHGSDCSTLVLKVRDDQNAEATFDLKLTITPVNDNPMFASDDYSDPLRVTLDNKRLSTKEDTPITIDLTAYYMDPDGPNEKLYIIWLDDAPVNGTVVYQDNKAVFSPSADYFTEDEADYGQWGSFGYTIADSSNGPAHGTVQIFIEPVNDAPVLKEKSYTGEEDEPLLIEDLFTGTYNKNATVWDIDNLREELAIVAVGKGSTAGVTTAGTTTGGGTVAVVQQDGKDWAVRYTPALDFTGTDTFWYTVSDGEDEATQKITLRITASDDPPRGNFEHAANWAEGVKVEVDRANMPTWSFKEDGTGTFKFMMWDPEGNLMLFDVTAQDFDPATSNCATLAQLLPSGAITNGGTGLVRTVTIKPAADKYGSFNLKFVLDDGLLKTTYIVPVTVQAVNDAPALDDAAFSVDEDQTLSNRVTGWDLETPAAQLGYIWDEDKAGPDHGAVTVRADGSFDYTPAANYFGEDAFYIKMSDKGATGADDGVLSVSAKVTVTVNPVNDAPGAPADFAAAGGTGPYKGGTAISLSWTGGEDLPFETHREDLTYLAEYRVDGGAWTPFTLANVSRNSSFEYTGEIPASVTAGKNTGRFDVRIATRDDGKVYKPDDVSLLKQLTALNSGYVQLTGLQIDSAAPTMGHTLSPAGWTNGNEITISLSAAAGSLGGATPIDRIEMEQSGSFVPIGSGASASTTVTENGTYKFRAYDAVGNESAVLEVVVATFDRVKPTVTASPAAITGKTVEDGPSVTLTFADGPAPSGSKDKVSGLRTTAGKQYQLTAAGDGCASGAWLDYTAPVTFPAKGSYTLHARVVDNAGNETIESFTGYVIDNAAPRVTNQTATVYEHSLADTSIKNSFAVSLAGTDADGDTLSYTMVDDAACQALKSYGSFTLNSATGAVTFTHNGNDVQPAHAALSLSCTVSDGTASVVVKLDVAMYPVNDAPTEADDLELQSAKAYYKAGESVTLGWTAGSDSETAPGALRYEVEYRTAATGSWASAGSYVTGAASLALTTPNTGTTALQYRVRVWDDNTADPNRDGSTAPAASGWVYSPSYIVDNASPTATHSFAPFSNNDGDSHAVVTLVPADGTEAWQSGVQSVAEPSGAQVIDAARYIYKITSGTPHSFVITDRAGNTTNYVVTANLPADPVISYIKTHVRHGTEIPVSWTHTSPGSHYELEVTYDDGATCTTVVPESLNHTAKTYTYRVPNSFAAAPDTAKMRFRVRAWDAGGMHSVNWDAGAAIICDSTPPTITLTPDIDTPTAGNVTVGYEVEDAPAGVDTVVVNTGAGDTGFGAGGAAQYGDNLVITGNTTVQVSATDACGNTHSASYVVANIDKSFPTVGLTAVSKGAVMAEGTTTPAPIEFTMEFADLGIGGLVDRQYAITATNVRPAGGWTDAAADTVNENAAAIGTYYVHMRAQDGVGNETYRCFGPFAVVNTQPVAQDLHYQVEEGGTLLITLNATDETPGDSIAAYTLLPPGPDYGTLTPKGNGQYEYQHDGVDPIANTSFTYYATDSHGEDSNIATVSITVVEVNDPPVLENLPADLTMTWNTARRLEGDLHDPDHLFSTLRVAAQSSNPAVLPISRISLGYARNSADENAGKLTLVLRPLRGT
ncbi:tandem-95 repeat protein, partial [Ruminococcaceae bacterium OttesenSCG-928-D13]|nr:tandem-95 repeat protein [Ruminococcaceae bacterium OttesenSCG-928-D13]